MWDHPSLLEEWLGYMGGMDVVVYAYVDGALDEASDGALDGAVGEGYVVRIDWTERLTSNDHVFFHGQHLAYQDCRWRAGARHDWLMMLDTDDFPFFGSRLSVPEELKALRALHPKAGDLRFLWTHHKSGRCPLSDDAPSLVHNLRVCNTSLSPHTLFKHASRTDALLENGVHMAKGLMPGFYTVDVNPRIGYVAHLKRMSREEIDAIPAWEQWWDPAQEGLLFAPDDAPRPRRGLRRLRRGR